MNPRGESLSALLDAIEDGVFLVDTGGRVLLANRAGACRAGGQRTGAQKTADGTGAEDQGQGEGHLDALSADPRTRATRRKWLDLVLRLGRPAYFELEDGAGEAARVWDVAMFPVRLAREEGDGARVAVVERDITQQRRERADLAAARSEREAMRHRLKALEKRLGEGGEGPIGSILGRSPAMEEVRARVAEAAGVDAPVLLAGEPGTGRGFAAAALHAASRRASGPLVRVDCAALDDELLEREIFGHARGAFSGATRARAGRVAGAEGGTLLLAGAERLGPRTQQRLALLLETGRYEPVGADEPRSADVRVAVCSLTDLSDRARRGTLRQDLYYLLRAMVVRLPALRGRAEDIPGLAAHFLAQYAGAFGKDLPGFSAEAAQSLLTHPWPGNVRELRHCVEHAAIRCPGGEVAAHHLPQEVLAGGRAGAAGSRAAGREAVLRALESCRWNKTRAARLLGISRGTLYARLRDFGISGGASGGEPGSAR
jgi:DNA-binding NtrC family response regulator